MTIRWKIAQNVELRWWQRYLGRKDKESYLAWKRSYWNGLLERLPLQLAPEDKILDAGCGPAGLFIALEGHEVVGIDPLIDAYAEQVPHFQREDFPHVQFVNQSLEEMDVRDSFDKVFCFNAINHVADLSLSLRNLWAAVKPGGMLILSTDAHRWEFLAPVFRLLPGDILHPQQYTWPEYKRIFQKQGIIPTFEMVYKSDKIFDYWVMMAVKEGDRGSRSAMRDQA
jgi:2-polyprenyl-6-hydroxyphenyl methylase/3-demethylubiquinone-9 3-methyltransferase